MKSIHSILPLSDYRYLCNGFSESLIMVDLKMNTASVYAKKFKGKYSQCLVPFPGFDEETFPLVLIKEWEHVVIFNIKTKEYINIRKLVNSAELEN